MFPLSFFMPVTEDCQTSRGYSSQIVLFQPHANTAPEGKH